MEPADARWPLSLPIRALQSRAVTASSDLAGVCHAQRTIACIPRNLFMRGPSMCRKRFLCVDQNAGWYSRLRCCGSLYALICRPSAGGVRSTNAASLERMVRVGAGPGNFLMLEHVRMRYIAIPIILLLAGCGAQVSPPAPAPAPD